MAQQLVTLGRNNISAGPKQRRCPGPTGTATDNLLKNYGGVLSRGGSLPPSIYADARYIDDVMAF